MSQEELAKLAKEKGVELTDDQLDKVAGGWAGDTAAYSVTCPDCGHKQYWDNGEEKPVMCAWCQHRYDW